ncbi:MAG: leucyl aminopeptidase [Candidatus Goldbacteria bacterium]|nr:leucyl aminopeptidase [Candidatus Goldiibacteriota bacterium]
MVEIKFSGKIFDKNVDYCILPICKNFNYGKYLSHEIVNEILSLIRKEQINSDYCGKTMLSFKNNGIKKFFFIGLGEPDKLTTEKIRQAAGFVIKELKTFNAKTILTIPWFDEKEKQIAQAEGLILASYDYQAPKKEKNENDIKCMCFYGFKKKVINPTIKVCKNVFLLRDLMNMPSNIVTPTYIENKAKEIAGQHKLKINSFTKEQAKKIGMEAFYSVAKGSNEPAKFITLEYYGNKKSKSKTTFIGKGITFDSGGISLKPQATLSSKIEDMRFDMSGTAVVLYLIKTAAELKLKLNIIGIMPVTENLPSGTAYKPGDVLKTLSGKTVEVVSTDAEGRLILADAMTYAIKNYAPDLLIDIATLTGGCVTALGHYATGLMGNDEEMADVMKKAGEETGERMWELPLWDEYKEQIKSQNADLKNSGGGDAATITAGCFLKEFAEDVRWLHLDIAGTAYGVLNKDYIPNGVAGTGLRVFINFLKKLEKEDEK